VGGAATLKESEYDSNKQIHVDMGELSDFLLPASSSWACVVEETQAAG
jgi:hypothetical protein